MSEQDREPILAHEDALEAAVEAGIGVELDPACSVDDLEHAARGDEPLAAKALEALNGRADLGLPAAKAALERIAAENAEEDSRKAPSGEGSDAPATIEAADAHASRLILNGAMALRNVLLGVVQQAQGIALPDVDAVLAHHEQGMRTVQARADLPPDQRRAVLDQGTRELEAMRALRTFVRRLNELGERAEARERIARP